MGKVLGGKMKSICLAVSVLLLAINSLKHIKRIEKIEFALNEVIDRYNQIIEKHNQLVDNHNRIARIIEESVNKGE